MTQKMNWEKEKQDWPNFETSEFIDVSKITWHVQRMGEGPPVLLLHGTGATTHSWRDLMHLLAEHFTVIVPDLPGHGFTQGQSNADLSLPGMSSAITALLNKMAIDPVFVIGHSAGAAVLIHMSIHKMIKPSCIVSLNGALMPFSGFAKSVFRPVAQLLFLNPFVPWFFAWSAKDRSRVARLLENTGSKIEPKGIELYERVFQDPQHVSGALGMMANWDLETLKKQLPLLKAPIKLIAAANDKAVPPTIAFEVRDLVQDGEVVFLKNLGHLAHEENPEQITEMIVNFSRDYNVLSDVLK